MNLSGSTTPNGLDRSPAAPRLGEHQSGPAPEVIRIRKYPNRRLYDTSRSRHLTHEGVVQLVAEGRTVQVTDSRSGADITNIVLLQIIIERDPAKLQALPNSLLHKAMRADAADLRAMALGLLEGRVDPVKPKSPPVASQPIRTPAAPERIAPPPQPSRAIASPAPNGVKSAHAGDDLSRPKARAKRID
jgi:polyhydroxyalkanoate synthesis repressor PhaR